MSLNAEKTKNIVEAALLSAGQPLSLDRLLTLFLDEYQPSRDELRLALAALADDCTGRGVELVEVGSGFRYQARQDYAQWVARLWDEKPARYSRALLETLSLIAYRQPITRGEIEDIRGVSVSSTIMKTLLEREWVKVVGYRDVPGKPAMYASTRQFLDYFGLKGLGDLPTLAEIRDIDSINAELDLVDPGSEAAEEDAAPTQEQQLSLDEIVAIKEAEVEKAEAEARAAEVDEALSDDSTSTLTDDNANDKHEEPVRDERANNEQIESDETGIEAADETQNVGETLSDETTVTDDAPPGPAAAIASAEPSDDEKSPMHPPQETTSG